MPRPVAVPRDGRHLAVHSHERHPQLHDDPWRAPAMRITMSGCSSWLVCDHGGQRSFRTLRRAVGSTSTPGAVHRRRSGPTRRSRAEFSEERRMTLGDIGVPVPSGPSGGPDLVQLLTPEGERVHHPDYPLEIDSAELRDLYRDLVLVRRIDVEATALQRQGELGIWASLLG